MIHIDNLRTYSLFAGLPDPVLERLRTMVVVESFDQGAAMVIQGEGGDRVHGILHGRAWVYVDGEHVASLGPGQQFGEMHLVDVQARSASVVAATPLRTVSLSKAQLLALQRDDAEAALMVLLNCARDVSRRLRDMNHRYVGMLRQVRDLTGARAAG